MICITHKLDLGSALKCPKCEAESMMATPLESDVDYWATVFSGASSDVMAGRLAREVQHLQRQLGYVATELMVKGDPRSLPQIVEAAAEATK